MRAAWGARRLIRSGSMELETVNVSRTADQAMQAAEALGGHLADGDLTRLPEAPTSASLVLRVPADRYFDLLDALRGLGDVLAERTSTEDITRAHADLEARLRVRRRAEARLMEMLDRRTENLGDVLRVETELQRVLEEIERLEGERRYFQQQTAFSSLSVILREPPPLVAGSPLALLQEALRESLGLLGTSALLLARLAAFLLPWLTLGALAWIVRQRLPRRA